MHQCSDAGRDKIAQLLVYLLIHHSVLLGLPLQVSLSYFIRFIRPNGLVLQVQNGM